MFSILFYATTSLKMLHNGPLNPRRRVKSRLVHAHFFFIFNMTLHFVICSHTVITWASF